MGELVEQIVGHEVGHTLGFRHNMKASSLYTVDQVRDTDWVHENGYTPSLMDYARFNYVAQPEDGIAVDGPGAEDRSVRQVGHHVGLHADSDRGLARRGEAHARRVGSCAGRDSRTCGS